MRLSDTLSKQANGLKAFRKDVRGATAVEYGLIVSLIAIFLMGTFSLLAGKLNGVFTFLGTFFSS